MLDRVIQRLVHILFFLGAALFLSILVLTMTNIGLRAMGSSLRGAVELSGYLGAAALGLCLPMVQYKNTHASGGVAFARLSPWMQGLQRFAVCGLCLALSVAFTLELADLTLFVHEGMEVVDGWDIASAYFVAALTLGCAGQGLVLALEMLRFLQKIVSFVPVSVMLHGLRKKLPRQLSLPSNAS